MFTIRTSLLSAFIALFIFTDVADGQPKLNVLFITVDDMNHDSLGVTGCKIPNISPNIDKLASQGVLFNKAHVTIAVCQPTRAVLMTGLYPHKNGAKGFEPIARYVTSLPELLNGHGYFLGLVGKVPHVVPTRHASFHYIVRSNEMQSGRSPDLYYRKCKEFFEKAKKSGKPFFLMANAHDPHRPFAGSPQEGQRKKGKKKSNFPEVKNPFMPTQVTVPGFLPDIPEVRKEMAEYYTSVRRADQVVGAVLRALRDAGFEGSTLVMFISDHGMALPFAKTNCYYHSTRTPWIVRWPGTTKAGGVDREHFISCIDFMPTILEAAKLPIPKHLDGRSFLPLLKGEKQKGRDKLLTVFHKTAGRKSYEMRAAHNKQFLYIWNQWSDGKMIFRNESQNGRTMKAMNKAAKSDAKIAARVKLFLYRVPEELYDYTNDPDCLHNLADQPKYREARDEMRRQLLGQLQTVGDPLAYLYRKTYAAKGAK